VLAGLVRDIDNPLATRFEVRAPNPHTNSYLAIAAIYMAMLNGIAAVLTGGWTTSDLEAEVSKQPGEPARYLLPERAYRTEEDVFEHFTQEDRDRLFGRPPATVAETLANLAAYPGRDELFCSGGVFTPAIVESYAQAMRAKWRLELSERIIPANMETVRECRRLHGEDAGPLDEQAWEELHELRLELMKDTAGSRSLFTRVRDSIVAADDEETSALQLEMNAKMTELQARYSAYARNLIDLAPAEQSAGLTNGHRLMPSGTTASP
jgi:glutamine synthetase